MKKILLLVILTLGFVYSKAQTSAQEKEVSKFLSVFYTKYITEVGSSSSPGVTEKRIALLQKQYCTSKMLAKIPQIISKTDADPFLKAQDADTVNLKTLSVVRANNKPGVYTVSYFSAPDNHTFVINLKVVKLGSDLKIDEVW
ncbi:hypothetical protein LX99_02897 [Mucilaginibacter oryzae]|uniref:DUF3828 domain-containing protein n=1 Tax=Mucilaginibacter oryzae TaxID=468058 RepID=A0A316H9E5_9SPHI|nr:hypothetical protein [Mucilaginibacter oryzae]PWK77087.1 hypothetical protein LX99_02897 [Mucilaginibacter oryzae]